MSRKIKRRIGDRMDSLTVGDDTRGKEEARGRDRSMKRRRKK